MKCASCCIFFGHERPSHRNLRALWEIIRLLAVPLWIRRLLIRLLRQMWDDSNSFSLGQTDAQAIPGCLGPAGNPN